MYNCITLQEFSRRNLTSLHRFTGPQTCWSRSRFLKSWRSRYFQIGGVDSIYPLMGGYISNEKDRDGSVFDSKWSLCPHKPHPQDPTGMAVTDLVGNQAHWNSEFQKRPHHGWISLAETGSKRILGRANLIESHPVTEAERVQNAAGIALSKKYKEHWLVGSSRGFYYPVCNKM